MTPFATGYIEAIRKSLPPEYHEAPLAPATLSRIIEDCERWSEVASYRWQLIDPRDVAASLWREQQAGNWAHMGFTPLTVTLGDDGLIYFREAGQ